MKYRINNPNFYCFLALVERLVSQDHQENKNSFSQVVYTEFYPILNLYLTVHQ